MAEKFSFQPPENGWKFMQPFDHEAWLGKMKWEDEILAKQLTGQSLEHLKLVKDILLRRIEEGQDILDAEVNLLNTKTTPELQKSNEALMKMVHGHSETLKGKIEKYSSDLQIVEGLLQKFENDNLSDR